MLRIDFEQLFFYHSFSRESEYEKTKVVNAGKWKDQDDESSREEEEDLEEVSADGELPIQGTNEDKDKDESDEDEAEIWKVTNCPTHTSHS